MSSALFGALAGSSAQGEGWSLQLGTVAGEVSPPGVILDGDSAPSTASFAKGYNIAPGDRVVVAAIGRYLYVLCAVDIAREGTPG